MLAFALFSYPTVSNYSPRVTYFPVDARGIKMNIGLRSLNLAQWFEFDDSRHSEYLDKLELLAQKRSDVLALHPAAMQPALEMWELALENLAEFHPERFLVTSNHLGQQTVFDHEINQSVSLVDFMNPLEALARLVQEDICVMVRTDEGWVLAGAVLCAPSRWRLLEKMGKPMLGIHEPVPGYAREIGEAVDFTMDRMTVQRPMYRFNWTLVDDAALFQPEVRLRENLNEVTIADDVYFRVERQTLRRLPRTDAIIFTIRSYVHPVRQIVETVPESAAKLKIALENAHPEDIAYKNWHKIGPLLTRWLQDQG
jgi:hypothetical protein